jgi:uncharacterized protein (TIGR02599 family)
MRLVRPRNHLGSAGFTLVEMLVSIAVFVLLMAMIGMVMNQTSLTIRVASSRINAFQSARQGFNTIAEGLSVATLNTYWDYDSATAPTTYVRKSDLQFMVLKPSALQSLLSSSASSFGVFFQAPMTYSLDSSYNQTTGLLNAIGYYVEYGDDANFRPSQIQGSHYRYRLMQAIQPTESLQIYSDPTSGWTTNVIKSQWPIAENVIAIILWPRLSVRDDSVGNKLTQDYSYDSRGTVSVQEAQMPPIVQLTLVAISESSAMRVCVGSTPPAVITSALQNKFTDVTHYTADLTNMESALQAANIDYKEFTTTVPIRECKWSGLQ